MPFAANRIRPLAVAVVRYEGRFWRYEALTV